MNPKSSAAALSPLTALPAGTSRRWRWHYRALLALRDRLRAERSEQFEEAAEPMEAHSMHPADSATDEFDHDIAFSLLAGEENALLEVEAAIQRLHRGVYGYCEVSGEPIPEARLRALPWCRCTVEAQKTRETPKI